MDEPKKRWVIPTDDSENRPPLLVLTDNVPEGAGTLVDGCDLLPRAMPDGWGVFSKENTGVVREQEVV